MLDVEELEQLWLTGYLQVLSGALGDSRAISGELGALASSSG